MAGSKARQLSLFSSSELKLKPLYINKPKLFDELFTGYQKLRAISYAASPITVLSIFEKFGFEQIQIAAMAAPFFLRPALPGLY
ncbi:MAG: hypothetical protein K9K64_12965 [Desulfohalobiaceae bacterium]|nr:hypothetical protein [Desulfohalobiaceae bacterium]